MKTYALAAIFLVSMIVVRAAPNITGREGEQIYTTGKDSSGQYVRFTGGPEWFKKSGGCIACHGADGRGGRIPHSGRYAPNIQRSVLASEGYTDEKIGRAITKGKDASGASLSSTMPRWDLNKYQLTHILEYLGKLGASQAPDKSTQKIEGLQIYLNGTASTGKRIAFSGGPAWFMAEGGGCASCHGMSGAGGTVRACLYHAPNIQYAVLKDKHYTDVKIKRSVTDGINAMGTQLNDSMPRWKMTDEQLDALVVYLEMLK